MKGSEHGHTPSATSSASSKARFRAYLSQRHTGESDARALGAQRQDQEAELGKKPASRSRPFLHLLREFWAILEGRRWVVACCVGTVTFSALVGLMMPASTKIVIDYALTDHPGPSGLPAWVPTRDRMSLLWGLSLLVVTATVCALGVGMVGRYAMTRLTVRTRVKVRRRVFNHAVRLPLHRVYQIRSGGAASILREDAGQASDLLFTLLYNPWRAIVQLVGTLAVLGWVDWRLLMAGLLLIPAAYLSQKAWIARIRPIYRDVRNTRQNIDAQSTEAFGGMRIVRGFARERGEAARFIRSNHLLARQEMLAWWWSRAVEVAWMLLIPVGSCALMMYGGWRISKGLMSVGDLMMFSAYLLLLLGPLESLSASATEIQSQLAAFDRVLDLLGEPTEFEPASAVVQGAAGTALIARRESDFSSTGQPVDRMSVRGEVVLEDVWFHYQRAGRKPEAADGPQEPDWVLKGVSLEARTGQTIALVGASGSGKTTLCNLVARFYDPSRGRVCLDRVDLRDLSVRSYRSLLGIVEQDVFMFDGSVRDNIAYAKRGATMEQIVQAARDANAHEFISKLEHGYDTLIGERGVRLSGGQKQRVAIARALVANPRILILDEATSNLDSESESLIQESLKTLMRGRTCFVIAHRLSTIRHADQILVLDAGEVVERGTHDELVAREGRYWGMVQRQLAGVEEASPRHMPDVPMPRADVRTL